MTCGPSVRGTTAFRSSPSPPYEFLLNAITRSEENVFELPDVLSQAGGGSSSHLNPTWHEGSKSELDLARDHIGSYCTPMICVMHDPLGAPRHRGSAPRCIGPKLPENSSLTTYRSCRTGREPGAPGRYEVRRASPAPSLEVPGTDVFGLCNRRAASDPVPQRPGAEPAPGK